MTQPILQTAAAPCPIHGCTRSKKREHAMCLPHWRRVPKDIQRRILANAFWVDPEAWAQAMNEAQHALATKKEN